MNGLGQAILLLLVLPFFGQSFYYLNQVDSLYFLSKAWPIIVLPLAILGMRPVLPGHEPPIPLRWLLVTVIAYCAGITPLLSMIHLGNGLADGLFTTVKIWPLIYYPAFAYGLMWLQPSEKMLRGCIIGLGCLTFILMVTLWVTVPISWYSTDSATSKILIYEFERGYRVAIPIYFGLLLMFFLGRQFAHTRQWSYVLLIAVLFVLLLYIFKQRTTIAMAALVLLLTACPPRWRPFGLALGLLVSACALAFILMTPVMGKIVDSLGNSLFIRLDTFQQAIAYIGDRALGWLFGMGAVTRFSSVTMAEILGRDYFFLADIGWLGIIFEYGIVGASLIAALYVSAYIVTKQCGDETGSPFVQALGDYILFMLLSSTVYSLVFVPGEMACALALGIYLKKVHAKRQRLA